MLALTFIHSMGLTCYRYRNCRSLHSGLMLINREIIKLDRLVSGRVVNRFTFAVLGLHRSKSNNEIVCIGALTDNEV